MDPVSFALGQHFTRTYTKLLRRRDCPGILAGLPTVMASPPTATLSAANASSSISSFLKIAAEATGAYTYTGPTPTVSLAGAVRGYTQGIYTNTSRSHWAAEFDLDTVGGAFDVLLKGDTAGGVNVLVNGQYVTANGSRPTFRAGSSDGAIYLGQITSLAAGTYRIKLEFEAATVFFGINVGATDTVRPVKTPPIRMIVIGDSFTEPTIVDTGTHFAYQGWVAQLGQFLGVDAWASGSGGTGYLNPGTGGKVKFRDRLAADVIPYTPDIVVWAGGINDYANYTSSAIGTEAALCYAAIAAGVPGCTQYVLAPFFPKGHYSYSASLIDTRDHIHTAAAAAGLAFLDVLQMPTTLTVQASATVTTQNTVGATTIASSGTFRTGTILQIGSGTQSEVRAVASTPTGTGPYTVTVAEGGQNLAIVHAVGEPIVEVGDGFVTGTGRQGNTTSAGNANRYTGNDATHPTVAGHLNIAKTVFGLLYPQLVT